MAANGATEHKSLADYAASKQNGHSTEQQYPVCDQNYGYNVLGCSDEVQLTLVATLPGYHVINLVSTMCSCCPLRCRNGGQGLT